MLLIAKVTNIYLTLRKNADFFEKKGLENEVWKKHSGRDAVRTAWNTAVRVFANCRQVAPVAVRTVRSPS